MRLLAIFPVVIAAIVNTGYQYLLALRSNDGEHAAEWRDRLVEYFSVDTIDPGVFDILITGLIHVLPVFVIALLAGGFCERLFADNRSRPFDIGIIYTALLFTLLMPPAVGMFHIIFAMSFAIIIVQGIFGGEGRSFLNPALVAVAVVQISFPGALTNHPLWTGLNGFAGTKNLVLFHEQSIQGQMLLDADWWQFFLGQTQGLIGTTSVLAILLGAVILISTSIASWRLMAGHLVGLVLMALLCNTLGEGIFGLDWYWHLVLGSFAFATVFIASDPSSSASTDAGRWFQGILAGALVVFFRVFNSSHPDGVITVFLLMSMTAPLIDHVVIWFNIRRRARAHG